MRIAIIGAGAVGSALGQGFVTAGHAVRYGVRDTAADKYAPLGTDRLFAPTDAIADADAIILATPWPDTQAALASLGDLSGRILIDATNPLIYAGTLSLDRGFTTSGGEQVAAWAAGAHVVKTFNQTGAEVMADPRRFPQTPVMFVAADDDMARGVGMELARAIGFEAVDAGPLVAARLLEPLAMLWIDLGFNRGLDRNFAIALTRPV